MVVEAKNQGHAKQALEALTNIRNDVLNRIRYPEHGRIDLDFLRLEYQKLESSLTEVVQSVIEYANARRGQAIQEVVSRGRYHGTGVDAALRGLDRRAYELVEGKEKHLRRDAEEIGCLIRKMHGHASRWRWLPQRTQDVGAYFEPIGVSRGQAPDGSIATAIKAMHDMAKVVRSVLIRVHAMPDGAPVPEHLDRDDKRVQTAFARFKKTVRGNLEIESEQKWRDLVSRGVDDQIVHSRILGMLQRDARDRIARARDESDRVREQIAAKRAGAD